MPRRMLPFVLLLLAGGAGAQTLYVDDELLITLRTGPSNRNAIIRNLESGERVEVLEDNGEGYARVRVLEDGAEGWALTQYLTGQPTGDQRVAAFEQEIQTARQRVTELEQQVGELTTELTAARESLAATQAQNTDLGSELASIRDASENALEIRDRNENLRRRVSELTQQVESATMINAELRSRSRQNWFIVGAGVLLGGIVIGLIAPSLRPKRRTNW